MLFDVYPMSDAVFTRILVVDDEPIIRTTLQRILARLTTNVVLAGTASEAIALLDSGVDLVITDVKLGAGGSGIDVARAARARHPCPAVIAISGGAEAAEGHALGQAGVAAFIAKPFTAEDILEVVEALQEPSHREVDGVVRRVVGEWPMPDVLDAARRSMVFEALSRTHGNKAKAAQLLGISRQHLQNILSRGKV